MRYTDGELRQLIETGSVVRTSERPLRVTEICVRIGAAYYLLAPGLPVPGSRAEAIALTAGATSALGLPSWWRVVAEFDDPPQPTRAVRVIDGLHADWFLLIPEDGPEDAVLGGLPLSELMALAGRRWCAWLPAGVREICTVRGSLW